MVDLVQLATDFGQTLLLVLEGLAFQARLRRWFGVGTSFLCVFGVEAFFVGKQANEAASLFFDEGKIAFCRYLMHESTALGLLGLDVHETVELSQFYLGFTALLKIIILAACFLVLQICLHGLIAKRAEILRDFLEGHLILILERRDARS